jgi:hypothetical protein
MAIQLHNHHQFHPLDFLVFLEEDARHQNWLPILHD